MATPIDDPVGTVLAIGALTYVVKAMADAYKVLAGKGENGNGNGNGKYLTDKDLTLIRYQLDELKKNVEEKYEELSTKQDERHDRFRDLAQIVTNHEATLKHIENKRP